jgi:hypothetical protein
MGETPTPVWVRYLNTCGRADEELLDSRYYNSKSRVSWALLLHIEKTNVKGLTVVPNEEFTSLSQPDIC